MKYLENGNLNPTLKTSPSSLSLDGDDGDGVLRLKQKKTKRQSKEVINRYPKKVQAERDLAWIRFNDKELFDSLLGLPHDLLYTINDGLWLQPRLYSGLKRRGLAYMDDYVKENHLTLTELQAHILRDIIAPSPCFLLFDKLLNWLDREKIEQGKSMPEEVKGDLRAYETLPKDEEEKQEKRRVEVPEQSNQEKLSIILAKIRHAEDVLGRLNRRLGDPDILKTANPDMVRRMHDEMKRTQEGLDQLLNQKDALVEEIKMKEFV